MSDNVKNLDLNGEIDAILKFLHILLNDEKYFPYNKDVVHLSVVGSPLFSMKKNNTTLDVLILFSDKIKDILIAKTIRIQFSKILREFLEKYEFKHIKRVKFIKVLVNEPLSKSFLISRFSLKYQLENKIDLGVTNLNFGIDYIKQHFSINKPFLYFWNEFKEMNKLFLSSIFHKIPLSTILPIKRTYNHIFIMYNVCFFGNVDSEDIPIDIIEDSKNILRSSIDTFEEYNLKLVEDDKFESTYLNLLNSIKMNHLVEEELYSPKEINEINNIYADLSDINRGGLDG